jgi:acyl dehydratase
MCDAYLNDSSCIGSPGIEELKFLLPVRPGDRLRLHSEVIEARRSASRPDRGIVRWRWDVLNQRDEKVMSMIGTQLFLVRGDAGAAQRTS